MLQQDITQQMLSSLALFKGIAKSHKGDVWAIVRDFTIATVKKCKMKSFDIQTLRENMNNEFNIDIENAVLTKVLDKLDLIYRKGNNQYDVTSKLLDTDIQAFEVELAENQKQCQQLIEELYDFYCLENNIESIEPNVKILIKDYFFRYIIDKEKVCNDSSLAVIINRFALKFENDEKRRTLFSNIRQGLIMLEGLNYSKSTDEKTWRTETTFFLDAHYLFSLYEFNSKYHKNSVNDFVVLVNKINDGCPVKNQGRKRILLTYFPETKDIMDKFFMMAYRIKNGDEPLVPNNEAMAKIVGNCQDPEDVSALKVRFYKFLENNNIEVYHSPIILQEGKDYLYETTELKELVEKTFKQEDQDEVFDLFLFADYINILRKGRVVNNLEDCRYIFLTDKNLAMQVSKLLRRNDKQARTNVFERMDWFTQRMWYLTCQSLTFDETLTSFDLAIKAKMVLSGICRSNVAEIYEQIKEKNTPNDEAAAMIQDMRNYECSADTINSSNSKELISKFSAGALEQFHESYQHMLKKAERAEDFENELRDMKIKLENAEDSNNKLNKDNKDLHKQLEGLKRTIRLTLWVAIPIVLILIVGILFIMFIKE